MMKLLQLKGRTMNRRIFTLSFVFIMAVLTPKLVAQTSDNWPELTVAFFDCNCSAAIVDSTSQAGVLNMASYYIHQEITADTTSPNLQFFSFGFADSLMISYLQAGQSFTLPDTGAPLPSGFIILSKITGSQGNFLLTISVLDGNSYAHVVDKSAKFASATDADVQGACSSAVAQLLPLWNTILTYLQSVRNANPSLCINPQITVSPAKTKIPLGGYTEVTFTATDCDGVPLPNRRISIGAQLGSFSSQSVITDNNGNASARYTAGDTNAVDVLSAAMENVITVKHDTITVKGAAPVIDGSPDTTRWMIMRFQYLHSESSANDQEDNQSWTQKTSLMFYSAHGFMIGAITSAAGSCIGDFGGNPFGVVGYSWCAGEGFYNSFQKLEGPCSEGGTSLDMTSESEMDIVEGPALVGFDYNPTLPVPQTYSFSLGWLPDSLLAYDFDEFAQDCETGSSKKHGSYKIGAVNPYGGKQEWDAGDPGFSLVPVFSPETDIFGYHPVVGCTVTINDVESSFDKSGGLQVVVTKYLATTSPLSSLTAVKKATALPTNFSLSQNYPNPFNPTTMIDYQLPMNSQVTLKVYDVLGREVGTLVNEREGAGSHSVSFNGSKLTSGIYFYRINATANNGQSFTSVKKLVVVK